MPHAPIAQALFTPKKHPKSANDAHPPETPGRGGQPAWGAAWIARPHAPPRPGADSDAEQLDDAEHPAEHRPQQEMPHPLMTATPATPALSALFLACVSPSGHGSAGSPREPPTERSPAREVAAMVTVTAVAHYAQETASGSPWRRNPARCPVSS